MTETNVPPLPDPSGLEHTMSPVDLPGDEPGEGRPVRWATIVTALATLILLTLNATALRGWAHELPPGRYTAPVIAAAEGWYDATARLGLNRPVDAMRGWWQGVQGARFGGEGEDAPKAAEPDPPPPTV